MAQIDITSKDAVKQLNDLINKTPLIKENYGLLRGKKRKR